MVSILTMGVLALSLAGAGTATAASVNIDGSGNVLSITNLFFAFDQDSGFFDVNFVRDTASNLYGENLNNLPFDLNEEAVVALVQVMAELNVTNPVPPGASTFGDEFFWIGVDQENDLLVAIGAEFFSGVPDEWNNCETDCATIGRPLNPLDIETYATFSPSSIVPIPAAVWLFGSALGLLAWMRRGKAA
jgi:hypothetical protein